jgi:pyruvate/2-oxoglutarate dehydrogenase complex dihydrolipoamide dehydrogenase (E3) component
MTTKYDLIVIGSGPAGEKGAAQAAYFGKKVALIEKASALGGAAANTGTLPSKTLRETALYLSGFRQRGLHGVSLSPAECHCDRTRPHPKQPGTSQSGSLPGIRRVHRFAYDFGDAG